MQLGFKFFLFGLCCGSEIIYPRSRTLIFIHPGTHNNNKRGGEQKLLSYLSCGHKIHKIWIFFIIFEQVRYRKKLEPIEKELYPPPKKKNIPDQGVKTRVADPDWIRIQSGLWIRIRNPDPDPGGQKWTTKVEKNCKSSCWMASFESWRLLL